MPLKCVFLFFISLWGKGPSHQNFVFPPGSWHPMVMWTLWAKSLFISCAARQGRQPRRYPCYPTNRLELAFCPSGLSLGSWVRTAGD